MIQLSNRKKIIILLSIVLVIIILAVVLIFTKNKSTIKNIPVSPHATSTPVRAMTRDEKIKVHISPNQEAEVVNEQNGLYIYRLKK